MCSWISCAVSGSATVTQSPCLQRMYLSVVARRARSLDACPFALLMASPPVYRPEPVGCFGERVIGRQRAEWRIGETGDRIVVHGWLLLVDVPRPGLVPRGGGA